MDPDWVLKVLKKWGLLLKWGSPKICMMFLAWNPNLGQGHAKKESWVCTCQHEKKSAYPPPSRHWDLNFWGSIGHIWAVMLEPLDRAGCARRAARRAALPWVLVARCYPGSRPRISFEWRTTPLPNWFSESCGFTPFPQVILDGAMYKHLWTIPKKMDQKMLITNNPQLITRHSCDTGWHKPSPKGRFMIGLSSFSVIDMTLKITMAISGS